MVSDTQDARRHRHAVVREVRLERLAQVAAVVGVVSILLAALPDARLMAWVPALVAVFVAGSAVALGLGQRRYAALAIVLGWFAFSYSFALMLWGSAA
jgi:hypothetical protein